jgi:hypothetical protein
MYNDAMLQRIRSWVNGKTAGHLVLAMAGASFALRVRLADHFLRTPYHEFTLHVTGPDQNRFLLWAERIRAGQWAAPGESPDAPFQFSPAYSWLLSLSLSWEEHPFLGIFALQAALSALAGLALWDCGRRLGCRAAGLAAAALWLFYAPSVFMDGCLIRESLLTSTGLLSFWAMLAAWDRPALARSVGAGLLLGACAALRFHLFIPIALGVYITAAAARKDRGRLASALVILLAAAALQLPVTARNASAAGQFAPFPTQGADALILGNDPEGPGIGHVPTANSARMLETSGRTAGGAAAVIGRELVKDPKKSLELYGRKLRMLFNDHEVKANYSFYVWKLLLPQARKFFLGWGWVFPLAVIGGWFAWRRRRLDRWNLALGSAAIFLAGAAAVHIQARYRFVAVPFVLLLAGLGLAGMWRLALRKKWFALMGCVLIVGMSAAAVRPDPSFGYYRVVGLDGVQRLSRDPLQESDYLTLLMSWVLSDKEGHADVIRLVSNRAARTYGLSVVVQFDQSVRALNLNLDNVLSRSYREKYRITR